MPAAEFGTGPKKKLELEVAWSEPSVQERLVLAAQGRLSKRREQKLEVWQLWDKQGRGQGRAAGGPKRWPARAELRLGPPEVSSVLDTTFILAFRVLRPGGGAAAAAGAAAEEDNGAGLQLLAEASSLLKREQLVQEIELMVEADDVGRLRGKVGELTELLLMQDPGAQVGQELCQLLTWPQGAPNLLCATPVQYKNLDMLCVLMADCCVEVDADALEFLVDNWHNQLFAQPRYGGHPTPECLLARYISSHRNPISSASEVCAAIHRALQTSSRHDQQLGEALQRFKDLVVRLTTVLGLKFKDSAEEFVESVERILNHPKPSVGLVPATDTPAITINDSSALKIAFRLQHMQVRIRHTYAL